MIDHPPVESPARSWLWVGLWSLSILAIIPFARDIRNLLEEILGPAFFTLFTLLTVALAVLVAINYLRRRSRSSISSNSWLALVAVAYLIGTLLLREAPVEALHFVVYGLLGLLAFRALTHHVRDPSIYLSAVMIAAIIGILDEAIQWITPRRFWGLRDIYIDVAGAVLMQIGIAKGLRPSIISWPTSATGIRWACRLGVLLALMSALTLLNTPQRIDWYSEKHPRLEFLKTNESVMLEYGYRFEDAEIGLFKSRFSEKKLKQNDIDRGQDAAQILNRFRDHSTYEDFLTTYTPVTDAFVHEARVHLFRRDKHLEWASEIDEDPYQYRVHLTVAYKENRLMEKYFPITLQHSDYVLDPETLETMIANRMPDSELPKREIHSIVSRHLVTLVREPQVLILLSLAIAAMTWIDFRFASPGRNSPGTG